MSSLTNNIHLNTRIWSAFLLITIYMCLKTNAESNISVPMVVFTNALGLEILDLNTLTTHELFSNGHNVFDIDVLWEVGNHKQPQIFWSDFQEQKIYGATLNNSQGVYLDDVEVIVQDGIGAVEGIAVDWIAKNLYWVESQFGQIEVINLDAGFRTILTKNMESPRAIAVDSSAGLLFWTDLDKNAPRIERCFMSGRERKIIVDILDLTGGVGGFPNGLTLDYNLQHLYWIDAKSNAIHSSDYDGLNHREIVFHHSSIEWPFGLCLFKDSLFWVDAKLKNVNKINVVNITDAQVLHETYQALYGITVLHPHRHPVGHHNPCLNNGGCSHLCTIDLNGGSLCHCPQMMSLENNGKTCKQIQKVVVVCEHRRGLNLIYGLDMYDSEFVQVTSTIVASPLDSRILEPKLDMQTGYVYWADNHTNSIWKASLINGETSRVLNLGFGNLTGFFPDFANNKVYYSMLGPHHGLFSCSLQKFRCSRILNNVMGPLSVVVQSDRNELFWCESRKSSSIVRSAKLPSLDNVVDVVDIPVQHLNGFTVDKDGTLFWIANDNVNMFHNNKQFLLANFSAIGKVTVLTSTREKLLVCINGHDVYSLDKNTGRISPMLYKSQGLITTFHYSEHHEIKENLVHNGNLMSKISSTDVLKVPIAYTPEVVCPLLCSNFSTCKTDKVGRSYCECIPGFASANCEANPCDNFCRNGQCHIKLDQLPYCICHSGYYGDHCEFSLCTNFCIHGRCEISQGLPVCRCPRDYLGHKCQFLKIGVNATRPIVLQLCESNCLNGGKCFTTRDQLPQCSCPDAYVGTQCEIYNSTKVKSVGIFIFVVIILLMMALAAIFVVQKRSMKFVKIGSGCMIEQQQVDTNFNTCKELHILGNKHSNASSKAHVSQSDCYGNNRSVVKEENCDRIFLLTEC